MQQVIKYEKLIFWLLVLIHLYPVLAVKLFPTLDGPAHLYNSNLINHILADGNGAAAEFFRLNIGLDPNYSGHFILCVLNSFLPAWLAEKLLLALIIIAIPLSFRMMLRSLSANTLFMDYLAFPFIYNFTFYLGFYNFTIGIALMFFAIAYWQKIKDKLSAKNTIILSLLLIAVYYSHLFTFLLAGLVIGLLTVWNALPFIAKHEKNPAAAKPSRQLMFLLLASLPALALTMIFLSHKGNEGPVTYLERSELIDWLVAIRPLITLNFEATEPYTRFIFFTFILLLLYIVASRVYSFVYSKSPLLYVHDSFLLLSLILLAMFFTLPDWMASGGYVSMRLLLFFFLFLIAWIGMHELNGIVKAIAVVVFLAVSGCFWLYHREQSKLLAQDALEIYHTAAHVDEGSVMLPVDHSGNWLHSNFSNYLGAEKNIVVLDNYEADKPQFPLRWRDNKAPYNIIAADFGNNYHPCLDLANYEKVSGSNIDYVLRWHFNRQSTDSCDVITAGRINDSFDLVYTSPGGKAELFRKKQPGR